MSLPHALLISLLEKSSTGFDLARRFDRSIGYFWPASHQQIYRELGRMEQAGWIAADSPPAGSRSRKKTYRVLEPGRQELTRWTLLPSQSPVMREDLLVKVRAEGVLGPLGLSPELRRRLADHQAQLATYQAIERRDFLDRPLSRQQQIQYLLLKSGLQIENAWIDWLTEALTILSALDGGPDPATLPPAADGE